MNGKDLRDLLDKARDQGFTVRLCGSGHYVVSSRRGRVSVSATPSGARVVANTRAALRRIGVRL